MTPARFLGFPADGFDPRFLAHADAVTAAQWTAMVAAVVPEAHRARFDAPGIATRQGDRVQLDTGAACRLLLAYARVATGGREWEAGSAGDLEDALGGETLPDEPFLDFPGDKAMAKGAWTELQGLLGIGGSEAGLPPWLARAHPASDWHVGLTPPQTVRACITGLAVSGGLDYIVEALREQSTAAAEDLAALAVFLAAAGRDNCWVIGIAPRVGA